MKRWQILDKFLTFPINIICMLFLMYLCNFVNKEGVPHSFQESLIAFTGQADASFWSYESGFFLPHTVPFKILKEKLKWWLCISVFEK